MVSIFKKINFGNLACALMIGSLTYQNASAFFDASLLVGKRWSEFSSDGSSDSADSTEITASAHLDPIPLIPVGFGLYYSILDYDTNASSSLGMDEFKGTDIGLEVTGWLPMIPIVTPYVKLAYPIHATFKGKYSFNDPTLGVNLDLTNEFSLSGPKFSAGVHYGILPLISASLEAVVANQTLTLEKTNGSDASPKTKTDYTSKSLLLGVMVRI